MTRTQSVFHDVRDPGHRRIGTFAAECGALGQVVYFSAYELRFNPRSGPLRLEHFAGRVSG